MSLFPVQMRDDRCVGDDSLNGVIIERRQFLRISLGTLAALAVNLWHPASARQGSKPQSSLSWDDLIERAIPLAERLIQSLSPDEEAYLIKISGLIHRRRTVPKAFFNLAQPVAIHESLRHLPLVVLQFRLAPGAAIPYHDHRDYNGVLTVTEGAMRIRSFEILGSAPRPPRERTFQIRETDDVMLTKGAQSTLSRTRDNIHDLRAGPEGAHFIDFFTFFHQGAHSAYLNVAEQPSDSAKRIFDASWA